jgi:hypothetical protein
MEKEIIVKSQREIIVIPIMERKFIEECLGRR